jgi:putative addiction module component (TIGR02574 family)
VIRVVLEIGLSAPDQGRREGRTGSDIPESTATGGRSLLKTSVSIVVSGAVRKMIEEALKLPEDERAEIAGELLGSLDGSGVALGSSSEAVEDRIARRLAEADGGSVTPLSWEDAQRFIDSDEPDR